MNNVLTIREAIKRAQKENMLISENALRRMIKEGDFPVRFIGRKALIYYPALIRYLQCIDGGDLQATQTNKSNNKYSRKVG